MTGGRTSETTVTFRYPFRLTAIDGVQPPGTYRVVVDEERIEGLTFPAFRRIATTIHLPAIMVRSTVSQVAPVDPAELDAALEADAKA
jgi:hypothetical protein